MVTALAFRKLRPDPEAGFGFKGLSEPVRLGLKLFVGQIENRDSHAARDIDPDGVRDHGVTHGEDASDGKPVPRVGVRHQSAPDRDGEAARVCHLLERRILHVALRPGFPGRGGFTLRIKRVLRSGFREQLREGHKELFQLPHGFLGGGRGMGKRRDQRLHGCGFRAV